MVSNVNVAGSLPLGGPFKGVLLLVLLVLLLLVPPLQPLARERAHMLYQSAK